MTPFSAFSNRAPRTAPDAAGRVVARLLGLDGTRGHEVRLRRRRAGASGVLEALRPEVVRSAADVESLLVDCTRAGRPEVEAVAASVGEDAKTALVAVTLSALDVVAHASGGGMYAQAEDAALRLRDRLARHLAGCTLLACGGSVVVALGLREAAPAAVARALSVRLGQLVRSVVPSLRPGALSVPTTLHVPGAVLLLQRTGPDQGDDDPRAAVVVVLPGVARTAADLVEAWRVCPAIAPAFSRWTPPALPEGAS